jgi:putative peptide zinc metalloprotease protein
MSDSIGFRLRPDVRWISSNESQSSKNQEPVTWIAQDPLSRRLFRCGQHEYEILHWLNESDNVQQLLARFDQTFAPMRMERVELQKLLNRCVQAGIVRRHSMGTESPASMIPKPKTIDRLEPIKALAGLLSKCMQTQVSLVNPSDYLAKVSQVAGILYSIAAIRCWMIFAGVMTILVGLRWDEFQAELPDFQLLRSPGMLVGLGVVFLLTRLAHELGHAIVCVRCGASCREMGVLLSFGMVVPYVDITDAWRIGNRLTRMGIAMAGIYTEMVIAACAAIVWLSTYQGPLHQCAMQTILVCTVSTILFNANPLMKYDGYFVLCDWLRMQNLRERSFEALDQWLDGNPSREPGWRILLLVGYFLASSMNRLVVSVGLAAMLMAIAAQWQLSGLGLGLILLYLACNAIIALAAWSSGQPSKRRLSRRATILGWVAACLLVSWSMTIPIPNRVVTRGVLLSGNRIPIYATVSGILKSNTSAQPSLRDKSPEDVSTGQTLIELCNPKLERRLLDLEGQLVRIEQQLLTRERLAFYEDSVTSSPESLQTRRTLVQNQLEEQRLENARLKICAPVDGRFEVSYSKSIDTLDNPSESPFGLVSYRDPALEMSWNAKGSIGRYVERGTLLGWIVTDDEYVVQCTLTEEQLDGVSLGTEARLRLSQNPTRIWMGSVNEIALMRIDDGTVRDQVPNVGGLQATEAIKPRTHQVTVRFKNQNELVESKPIGSGMTELVLLRPNESLMSLAIETLLRNFRF